MSDEKQSEKPELKEQLLAELKKQLAEELKDEIKKEIAEDVAQGKAKKAKKKDDSPEVIPKESSAVLSSTGRIQIPKHLLSTLGWNKDDVIDLKIEGGKIIGEKIGHTAASSLAPSKKGSEVDSATGESVDDQGIAVSTLNLSKYFEFEFSDKRAMAKMRQILENAYNLYEGKSPNDAITVLHMIETVELKEDEPDRSKMRLSVIKFLNDVLPKYPEVFVAQWPQAKETIEKMSSRYLREKGFILMAEAWKSVIEKEMAETHFEEILDILFMMLGKYQVLELFGIISLLESIINLLKGTESPHIQIAIDFIKETFGKIDDFDYKIRFLDMLTILEAFKDVKTLGRALKEETMEGTSERRNVLDALKENREKEKLYFEKHPELQPEDDDGMDAEILEEIKEDKKKGKNSSKKKKDEKQAAEKSSPDEAEETENLDEEHKAVDEFPNESSEDIETFEDQQNEGELDSIENDDNDEDENFEDLTEPDESSEDETGEDQTKED